MFGKAQTSAGFESGARAALKAAIEQRDAAEARVAAARKALDRIGDQVFEAQRRLGETRAGVAEEAHERVGRIIAGGSAVLERRNRARAEDVETQIEELKEARGLIRGELADAEKALDFKVRRVTDAVNALLASSAPRLIEQAEAVRDELIRLASVLRYFRSSVSDTQRRRIDEVTAFPTDFDRSHSAVAPWQAAASALAKNADSALPE